MGHSRSQSSTRHRDPRPSASSGLPAADDVIDAGHRQVGGGEHELVGVGGDEAIEPIERGMRLTNHELIEDRRDAIVRALEMATPEDVVLLAGKGHETYQVRGTTAHPFDERAIVAELTR